MTFLIKHFDTINADYTLTPFNCSFQLLTPLKKIKKIYLKSFELSIDFTNIRTNFNTFSIKYNNIIYTRTLNNNNYTSITNLLNDLNTAFTNCISGITILFTNTNNLISLTLSGTSILPFNIINTNLALYILGFKFSSNSSNSTTYTITASNQYLLTIDNYLIFNLSNLPFENNNNSQIFCNFKIPLNANNGMVYFENEFNNLSQYITNSDNSLILSNFKIQILDRFGNQLISNNNDFSFSLGFEIDN